VNRNPQFVKSQWPSKGVRHAVPALTSVGITQGLSALQTSCMSATHPGFGMNCSYPISPFLPGEFAKLGFWSFKKASRLEPA
jgi:hypothetical protein